jgi:hypothetical protein
MSVMVDVVVPDCTCAEAVLSELAKVVLYVVADVVAGLSRKVAEEPPTLFVVVVFVKAADASI